MASPFASFSGRGQRGATTSAPAASRGRGAPANRGAQFQPRGNGSFRGRFNGNRGRGGPPSRGQGRGRGRGGGAGTSPETTPAGPSSQTQTTNSPFAQLNINKPASNPFGATKPNQSFSGLSNSTQASPFGPMAESKQQAGKPVGGALGKPVGGFGNVPVENATILAKYHERYDKLKLDRAKQRQTAIRDGQMADPNKPTSLNKAITPVGTCQSMCPEFERVERIVQKMVDKSEKFLHPSSKAPQNMETKMLKRFRRSAAGYDEQLPSDIRTPNALLQTTNYLIRHIVGGGETLGIIHKFVWDRTRSVRNDFSVQQLTQEKDVRIAVTCLERIARFHILSHHLLSSPANEEPFEHHQEREQLNNTMLSLMYYYDDNRGKIHFPNEDEFRAYHIILSIHDQRPDLEARVSRWPAALLTSPRVQVALDLYAAACNTWEPQGTLDSSRKNAIAQGFYTRFFNIIDSPSVSYLMACVAEFYFSDVRQTALRDIWKGYWRPPSRMMKKKERKEEWTMTDLTKALRFDDEEQTLEFCKDQNMPLGQNADGTFLNWDDETVDSKMLFSPPSGYAYSESYVEFKRAGRSLVAVILGMSVKEAAIMGMIEKSELVSRNHTSLVPSIESHDVMMESPASAPPNPFQTALPATNVSSLAVERPTDTPSDSATPQPSNPFGKPFPAANGSALGTQPATTAQSIVAPQPSNPFAKAFSPPNDSVLNSGQSSSSATPQPSNPFHPPTTTPFTSMFSPQPPANGTTQPSPPPNPFGSMFSGATATSGTATPAPTSNPMFSAKPPGSSAPTPTPSPFSFTNPTGSTKTEEKKAEPTSSPFASAGLFKPAGSAASTPNPFGSVQSSTPSPFPPVQAATPPASSLDFTALAPTANPFFPSQPKDDTTKEAASEPVSLFQPAKPMFPSTGTSDSSSLDASAAKPASPFNFASPAASSEVSAPKAASPFSFASPAATATVDAPNAASPFSFAKPAAPAEVAAAKPASLFNFASPGVADPAPKPASPFNFPSTAATTEASAPQSGVSIFSNPPQTSAAPFQFPSTAKSKEFSPEAKESTPPPFKFPSSGHIEKPAAEQNNAKSLFDSVSSNKEPALEAEKSTKSLFQSPAAAPSQKQNAPPSMFSTSTSQPQKPLFSSSTPSASLGDKTAVSQPQASIFSNPAVEKAPVESNNQTEKPAPPKEVVETSQPGTRTATLSPSLDSSRSSREPQSSNKRKFDDGPFLYTTAQEKQASWDRLLQRAEEKRAREQALELEWEELKKREKQVEEDKLRKRTLEQSDKEDPPQEPETKLLKVSDLVPNSQSRPVEPRSSIFEASTRPLMKLPCLERAEATLKRKEPSDDDILAEAQRRRQYEIDQDELLFSAARIAAEQLKNGPKIFEKYAQPTHESLRYSYSPHRSFSASLSATPYSQSTSPPDLSRSTHGYKVAYAPDTPLGLGRTLSRTEERIRRTGGHGLAYIPLDFSKSQRKTPDGKNQFSRSR